MDTLYSSDMGLSSMSFTCEDCNAVFTSRDSYAMHVMIRAKDKSCRSEVYGSDSTFGGNGRSDAAVGDSVEVKASLLGLQPSNGKDTLNLVEQADVPISEIENCIKEVKQEVISNDGSNIGSPVSMTPKLVVVKTEPENNSSNSSKECSVMESGSSGLGTIQRRLVPGADHPSTSRSESANTPAVSVRSSSNLGNTKALISSHHVICLLCDSQFLDQDSLAMHMMSFHSENVAVTRSQSNAYRDHSADSSYSSLQHFDLSPLSHYRRGSMRYRCDECGVGFDNEDFLTLHLISHRRGIQAITTASLLNEHTRAYSHMLGNKRKREQHQTHYSSDINDSGWSLPVKKPMLQESKAHDINPLGKATHLPLKNFLNKYSKGYSKTNALSSDPMICDGRSVMGKPLSVDHYRRFYERCGYFASSTNFPTSSSSSSSTASTSSPSMARCVNDRSQSVPNESKTEAQKSDLQRPHSVGFLEKCQMTRNKYTKEARSADDIDHRGSREISPRIKDSESRLRKSGGSTVMHGKGQTVSDSSSKDRIEGETTFYEKWSNPNARKEKNHLIISAVRTLPEPSHVGSLTGSGNARTDVISTQAQQQQQQGKQEHCVSSSNGCDTAFTGVGSSADILRELKGRLQDAMMCKHCDVIFLNRTLYHLHMGLHNVNNPWQCNICGRACNDVHDFTAHVIHF